MSRASRRRARLERKRYIKQSSGLAKPQDATAPALEPAPPESLQPTTIRKTRTTHLRSLLRNGLRFVLGIATLIGFVSLWPRIQVLPPADVVDLSQPFRNSFSLQNNGVLPIYKVEVQCLPYNARWFKTEGAAIAIPFASIGNRRYIADEIPGAERRPFACDVIRMLDNPYVRLQALDVVILVRFRPIRFIPWNWPLKSWVFETLPNSSGNLRWHEYLPPLKSTPAKYPAQ